MRRLMVVAAAVMVGATGVAAAQMVPSEQGDDVIVGCVASNGRLSVVASPDECRHNETPIQWSVAGPPGSEGPEGPPGPAGPAGPAGGQDPARPTPDVDLFLALDGLPGPVSAGPDAGWFPLLDYTHTIDVPIPSGGGGAFGAPAHQPFQVERHPDVATPWLLERLHQGMAVPAVTVRACHAAGAGNQCFLEVELQNVVVRAVDSEAERISAPIERVAFDYTTIVWRHGDVANPEGQVRVSTYDAAQNTFTTTGTTGALGLSAELNEDTHPLYASGTGLAGDVTTPGHADTILVTGVSQAVTRPGGSMGGGGAGAAQHDPLEVRTVTDRSTPDLLARMHQGQVTLEFSVEACPNANGTQEPCDTTTIHNALVASLTYDGSQAESWSFVYSSISWEVDDATFGWDLQGNVAP